jgi:enoyl-CoA hydratase/carnithine racemase
MPDPVLLIEKKEGIATLTLNRPRAMNALSLELRRAITDAFSALAKDAEVGCVIVTGAGDRAFCAGLDLKELAGEGLPRASDTGAAVSGGADLIGAMEAFDRPIIGAVNGVAITGGFELALACDFLIASTRARFADTHARVGIMPGWGLSQKLSRLVGIGRAKEISLTGNFVSAEEAAAIGLVNRVVAPEELLATCERLARDMLSCEPGMVSAYKRVIDQGFAGTFRDGRRLEVEASREHSRSVTPGAIAESRRKVMARGREQVS